MCLLGRVIQLTKWKCNYNKKAIITLHSSTQLHDPAQLELPERYILKILLPVLGIAINCLK